MRLSRRPPTDRPPGGEERGNALLVIIGLVGLLAAIGVAYQATTQSQSRMFDALAAKIANETAADAAVNLGIWRVAENWRGNPEKLEAIAFRCLQDGADVVLTIESESRRLNVNLADATAIAAEMIRAGVSPQKVGPIAERIANYVDRDELTADGRPETAEFAAAGAATPPKNAPLDLIDELLLTPGVDGEMFSLIGSKLSLHSTRTDRLKRSADGAAADVSPARGVFRIRSRVLGPYGAVFDRTAIIELDPARPLEPAVRMWRRNGFEERQNATIPAATARACRDVVLTR